MQFVDYLLHLEHRLRELAPFARVNAIALIFVSFVTFLISNAGRCQ